MKKLILIAAMAWFILTVLYFTVWRARISDDLTSDEPPFNSITLPLRSLKGKLPLRSLKGNSGVMGDDLWIEIVDSEGASFFFIFRYDDKTNGYKTVYYVPPVPPGVIESRAVPLANPDRARAIALTWLRQNENRNENLEQVLNYLSGHHHSILRRSLNWIRYGVVEPIINPPD
jgi:hypothetical protein